MTFVNSLPGTFIRLAYLVYPTPAYGGLGGAPHRIPMGLDT
jgi:hypothetical protein